MTPAWISLAVFSVGYALFAVLPHRRSLVACGGALVLLLTGAVPWHQALCEMISWNVIALFVGTLVLAHLFMESRMPAVMAEWLVDRFRTARGAMIAVCLLAGVISAVVENVAVVLLVAPVAFSLARKLKTSPVPLLIGVTLSSNLQGTATLIGDPPSMIAGSFLKMSFNDFFVYHGRPGIFFAVQIGALASAFVLGWFFRAHREKTTLVPVEKVRAWTPGALMLVLMLGLATTSVFDPDFKWLAGTLAMGLALVGLVWQRFGPRWTTSRELILELDWDTTFFLVGVFVLVGGISESGWIDRIAAAMIALTHTNLLLAYVLIVTVSVLASAFVDNVPFILVMLPVARKLADSMGGETLLPVLVFGMLVGTCVGGNITPIGASANVVTIGLLRKEGHTVGFGQFVRYGLPFTAAAVLAACVFVWLVWAPR